MRGKLWPTLFVLSASMSFAPQSQARVQPTERPRVAGQVIDAQDSPVSGATVFWCTRTGSTEQQDETIQAACDDQGRFQLEASADTGLTADSDRLGHLWVLAEGNALGVVPAKDFRVGSETGKKAIIRLLPAAQFALRVVDEDGRARDGELVEAVEFLVEDRRQATIPRVLRDRLAGITDANGEHHVKYVKDGGQQRLRVVSEKYGIQEAGTVARDAVPVVTFQLLPAARIEGVTVGENPKVFAGMRLAILGYDPAGAPDQTGKQAGPVESHAYVVIGDDGRFDVPAIGAGILVINPERRGTLDAPVINAPRDLFPGTTEVVRLAPEPTTTFRGTVVTEGTDEPVAKASVTISSGKGRMPFVTETDAKGAFSIISFARDSQLRAAFPDNVVQCREVVQVRSAPGVNEVVCPPIKLPATRRITGTLRDSRGRPVAEAEVIGLEVAIHHGSGTTSSEGRFELITAAERTITDYVVHVRGKSRTVTIRRREPLELMLNEKRMAD